jgi:hypothetical protein
MFKGQQICGEQKFCEPKFLGGSKNVGGQHFWGVVIVWGSTFLENAKT